MKATDLLENQHLELSDMFEKFLKSDDVEMRETLSSEIRSMVDVHTTSEEEVLIPAGRDAVKTKMGDGVVLEAFEERQIVDLLAGIPKLDSPVEN